MRLSQASEELVNQALPLIGNTTLPSMDRCILADCISALITAHAMERSGDIAAARQHMAESIARAAVRL